MISGIVPVSWFMWMYLQQWVGARETIVREGNDERERSERERERERERGKESRSRETSERKGENSQNLS